MRHGYSQKFSLQNLGAWAGPENEASLQFGCGTGNKWVATADGSAGGIFTEISDRDLLTPLRTDCGVCISPARNEFNSVTNNPNHCGGNLSTCMHATRIVH